jgi:hypothetical protein
MPNSDQKEEDEGIDIHVGLSQAPTIIKEVVTEN